MSKQAFRSLVATVAILVIVAGVLACSYVNATVQGEVRDGETGEPLAGAAVSIGPLQAVTDAQGRFEVQGVHGVLRVQATAGGYKPAQATPLPRALLSSQQRVSLKLEPVVVTGAVYDAETQAPLAGAMVRAGDRKAQADAEGHYVLTRVRPAAQITASAPYYGDATPVAYDGQATVDLALTLLSLKVQVHQLYSGQPLAGATVTAGEQTLQSDAQGEAVFARVTPQAAVAVTLTGYAPASVKADPGATVDIKLRPNTLRGSVRDQDGQPLADALVLLRAPGEEPRLTHTSATGEYECLDVPANASVIVRKAGYARAELPLGQETRVDLQLEPFVAKGLYIPFGLLVNGVEDKVLEDLDLVASTEMNTVVIDIKGDRGYLAFEPTSGLAKEIDAGYDDISDLGKVLEECKRRGIYTIARMVVFKDNVLAEAKPEWAVHRGDGSLWRDLEGLAWADPFRQEVWEYNLEIAKEAVDLGFDEIQFDYLRFPSDGDIYDMEFSQEAVLETRCPAIAGFLAYVRKELDKTGTFFSADLFGLVTSVDPNMHLGDLGIGQRLIDVGPWVDYISPMVYPSMYQPGHLGLSDPWRQPYEVVKISVEDAKKQTTTLIRPWLQHYSLFGVTYGAREYRLEKQGAVDSQAHGWLFWNAGGTYDPGAFDPR